MNNILTKRERTIFEMIVNNYSTKEISNKLKISDKTVRNHISNVIQKLDAKSRCNAIVELIRLGELKI